MILGLDISSYQGQPDFNQIKAAGKSFVFIKLTESTNYVNPYAAHARADAHAQGLGVGLYHFARATDAVAEAKFFVTQAGTLVTGEVLALDWEVGSTDPVGWCKAFCDEVIALTGVRPLVYLNQSLKNGYNWQPVIGDNDGLWEAVYDNSLNAPAPAPWPFVAVKQYTSSGQVPGVVGNVDLNVFYGDLPTFQKYGKQGGAPTPPPSPPPAPTPAPAPSNDYVVRPGDTMGGIAAAHGLTLAQLEAFNPQIVNPNLIYAGEVVHLGGGARPQQQTYRVVSGDTMSRIAAKFGLSLAQLEAMNPSITNPNLIFVGQVINV